MFDVSLNPNKVNEGGIGEGLIRLGSYRETFEASIMFWSAEDYEAHWLSAVDRVLGGATSTAFVTDMYDPESANFIRWWPAYRFGDEIRFQNQLLFLADLEAAFDPGKPFEHVGAYREFSEEGEPLSQWCISLHCLQSFERVRKNAT